MSTFKNEVLAGVGITATTIYEVLPDDEYIVIIGLSVTNLLGTDVTISLRLYDASTTTYSHIEYNRNITTGTHYIPIGGSQKIVLELNDKIDISCSDATGVDVMLSYMVG